MGGASPTIGLLAVISTGVSMSASGAAGSASARFGEAVGDPVVG
jgi:hypothetical protein